MTARAAIHCDAARHGYAWHVEYDGERIVTGSRDPDHDACRALLARGVTGPVEFIDGKTGRLRFTIACIEEAARWHMEEGPTGPRRRRVDRSPASLIATVDSGHRVTVRGDWRRAAP